MRTLIDLTLLGKTAEAEQAEAERNALVYINMGMESLARPVPEQVAAILETIANAPRKMCLSIAPPETTGLAR